jgi:hypothetical protein
MKEVFFNNYIKQILFIFIFININQIVISEEGLFLKSLNLDYTHALSLINGNIFILHKDGVIVYNYNFTIILYNYNFDGNPIIPSEEENVKSGGPCCGLFRAKQEKGSPAWAALNGCGIRSFP